jgi:hypothetical protein
LPDITIIYLTANKVPESWAQFQRQTLLETAKDIPIISISREPIDLGQNILDDGQMSTDNIYRQMLRGFKLAETPFVAMAEDDVLYPPWHFDFHRPQSDTFAYNKNRLLLFTWGQPMYHWRDRLSNATLIAPRELAIETLEERFAKWPSLIPDSLVGEMGRYRVEKRLGVSHRKVEEVYSKLSVIHLNHINASEERQRTKWKSYGPLRSYDIPHWGKAEDIVKKFQ